MAVSCTHVRLLTGRSSFRIYGAKDRQVNSQRVCAASNSCDRGYPRMGTRTNNGFSALRATHFSKTHADMTLRFLAIVNSAPYFVRVFEERISRGAFTSAAN